MISTRRAFLKKMGAAGVLVPFAHWPLHANDIGSVDQPLKVHLFSKHLQFLDYQQAGEIAAELGFEGLDLTVRPKGHVLPENVETDLPKAVKDISKSGSSCELITTSISSVEIPKDVNIIKSAAQAGIKYYRTGWFKYKEDTSFQTSIDIYRKEINALGELNKDVNIIGCYQNHSGTNVGASFWEIQKLLETVDTQYFGAQYDIRHAMVEGGKSWINGFNLLKNQMKVIVLKDFEWGQTNGKWKPLNKPIGEGMVDFTAYFKLLKANKLNPPVSLHLEYPLGGAEKGHYSIQVDKKVVFDAMKKDLSAVQKMWKEA